MSLYGVHSVCRDALKDTDFRSALNADPQSALGLYDLTASERQELIAGDVAALYAEGAHEYALMWLGRAEVFGLTVPEYMKRITTAEPHYVY
jgi:hypothetical protein